MKPLRINFELVGPIGRPARPIHLDSLIAHELVQRDLPIDADIPSIRSKIEQLPLERGDIGGDWVWKASTLAFEWMTPPAQRFAIRAANADAIMEWQQKGLFNNRRADSSVDTSRGVFKSAIYAHEIQWARQAVAYCIGDEDEVTALVSEIENIGARRRLGGGRVARITVTPDEQANELWMRRYLPNGAPEGRLVEGAYRLPLFDRTHQTVVRDNSLEVDFVS